MPKLQLSFHTTFALRKDELKRILTVAQEEGGLNASLDALMSRTSLGNKKVGPVKSWATRSGLIADGRLTPEGWIITEYDPLLTSPVTDWLMHFYLSLSGRGLSPAPAHGADWGGWTYFVYNFVPERSAFSLGDLTFYGKEEFAEEKENNLNDNFKILLRAYTERDALSKIEFIKGNEADGFRCNAARLPNGYAIGYILARIWQRDFGTSSELTKDVIAHPMGIAKVLGITPEQTQEHLDVLEALSIVEQRKTVGDFQVARRWSDPLDLLKKAYERD
jgi:Protein of unknown function (DUF4007)